MIDAFAVGMPARNEARTIVAAIDALAVAARDSPAPVHLAIAADRCNDGTEQLARRTMARHGARAFRSASVIRVDVGAAGAARQAACATALRQAQLDCPNPGRLWIATTDADSAVPAGWFALHEAWACSGADGVAGLVELLPDDTLDLAVHQRWRTLVDDAGAGQGHPHVHGANLGIRADLWLEAGGFAALSVGEDHDLWRRARALGATLVGCSDMVVQTSARRKGRATGGFASLLAGLERQPSYARPQS